MNINLKLDIKKTYITFFQISKNNKRLDKKMHINSVTMDIPQFCHILEFFALLGDICMDMSLDIVFILITK